MDCKPHSPKLTRYQHQKNNKMLKSWKISTRGNMSCVTFCSEEQVTAASPQFPRDTDSALAADIRARLSEVEATAVQVSLFRKMAVKSLLRPDGLPYYDATFDEAIVSACLPAGDSAEMISHQAHMLPFMVVRTAEIDHHIMQALQLDPSGPAGPKEVDSTVPIVRQVVLLGAGLDARAWRLLPAPLAPLHGRRRLVAGPVGAATTATATATIVSSRAVAGEEMGDGDIGNHHHDHDDGRKAEKVAGPAAAAAAAAAENGRVGRATGYYVSGGDGENNGYGDGGGSCDVPPVFYELDSGALEQLKVAVLGQPAGCCRVFLSADLGGPATQILHALAAAGHDARRPTVFVAEGLIGYLTVTAGDALLAALRSIAAPGSSLLLSAPPSPQWRDQLVAQGVKLHHVTYEEAKETCRRAQAAGWETRLMTASELGAKYGVPDNRFELIIGC